jgi:hypothetical protein
MKDHNTLNPGLTFPSISTKDYIAEKIFGGVPEPPKPLGYHQKVMDSPLKSQVNAQYRVPACVPLTVSWMDSYFSWFKSKNKRNHSGRFLYAQVPHYSGGTSPRDVLEVARKKGVCRDEYLPDSEFVKGQSYIENDRNRLNQAMYDNAEHYKFKNHAKITDLRPAGLYRMMKQAGPIIIGIPGNNNDWDDEEIIKKRYATQWYHMVVLLDFDEAGNKIIVNWNWFQQQKIEILKLDKSYPVTMAYVSYDLPDTEYDEKDVRNMIKFVKVKKDGVVEPAVYMIDTDDKYHTFITADSLYDYFGTGIKKYIEVVQAEELQGLEKGTDFDLREKEIINLIKEVVEKFGSKIFNK